MWAKFSKLILWKCKCRTLRTSTLTRRRPPLTSLSRNILKTQTDIISFLASSRVSSLLIRRRALQNVGKSTLIVNSMHYREFHASYTLEPDDKYDAILTYISKIKNSRNPPSIARRILFRYFSLSSLQPAPEVWPKSPFKWMNTLSRSRSSVDESVSGFRLNRTAR